MKRLNGPRLTLSTALVQDNIPAPVACCQNLYLGSIHAAFNVDYLKELGVTHVLNASGLPPTFPKAFTYLSVDVRDKDHTHILGCIPAANIFIDAGLASGGSVLVHCAGGRSRSAALVAAFLMSSYGLSCTQALEQCRAARPLVNVNIGFQLQLLAFGASGCDVHAAHQILLHKRLERFSDKLLAAALEADAACAACAAACAAAAAASPDDDDRALTNGSAVAHDDAKGSADETGDSSETTGRSNALRLGKKPPSLVLAQRSESAPQQNTSSSSLRRGDPVHGWRTSGRRGTASVDEAEEALLAVLDAPLSQSAAPRPNWPKLATSTSGSSGSSSSSSSTYSSASYMSHYHHRSHGLTRHRSRSGSSSDGQQYSSSSDCEGSSSGGGITRSHAEEDHTRSHHRPLVEPLSPASPLDPGVRPSRDDRGGSRLASITSAAKPVHNSSNSTSGRSRSNSKSRGGSGGAQLRLSRPHMAAVQVIPPLRALERPLSCRQCSQPLFAYASVLRLDLDPDMVRRCDAEGWARRAAQQRYRNPLQAQNEPFTATPRLGGSDGCATPRLGNSSSGNSGSSNGSSSSNGASRFGFDFSSTNDPPLRESAERDSSSSSSSVSSPLSSDLPPQGRPRRSSSADDLTFAEPKVPPSHRRGGPAHSVAVPSAAAPLEQQGSATFTDPHSNGSGGSSVGFGSSSSSTTNASNGVRDPFGQRVGSMNNRNGSSGRSNGSRPMALSLDTSQHQPRAADAKRARNDSSNDDENGSDDDALHCIERQDYEEMDDDSALLGLELEPLDLSDENTVATTATASSSRPGLEIAPLSMASPVPALQWPRSAAGGGGSHSNSSALFYPAHSEAFAERKKSASSSSGRESPPVLHGCGGQPPHLPQLSGRSNASSCWSSPRSEPGSARVGGGDDGSLPPLAGSSAHSSNGSINSSSSSSTSSASASALEKRQASEEKRRWWLTRLSVLEAAGAPNGRDDVITDFIDGNGAKASSSASSNGSSSGRVSGSSVGAYSSSRITADATGENTAGSTVGATSTVRFPNVVSGREEKFGVRAAKVAAADEEAQRKLHSQTLPASWAPTSSSAAAVEEAKNSGNSGNSSSGSIRGQRSHQPLTRADFKAAVEALEDSTDDSVMADDDDKDEVQSATITGAGNGSSHMRHHSNGRAADAHSDNKNEIKVEKAFFVEPLPWMDLLGAVAAARAQALTARAPNSGVLHSESTGLGPSNGSDGGGGITGEHGDESGGGGGALACPGCGCELGRWGWEKRPTVSLGSGSGPLSPFSPVSSGSEEASSSLLSSFDGGFGNMSHAFGTAHAHAQAAAASAKPLLRIAVLRKRVFASPLPSEVVTPREEKEAEPGRSRGGSGAGLGRDRSESGSDRPPRSPPRVYRRSEEQALLESHGSSRNENEAKGSKEIDSRA